MPARMRQSRGLRRMRTRGNRAAMMYVDRHSQMNEVIHKPGFTTDAANQIAAAAIIHASSHETHRVATRHESPRIRALFSSLQFHRRPAAVKTSSRRSDPEPAAALVRA